MTAPLALAVVGSINVDLTARTARLPEPGETIGGGRLSREAGGKGANQAAAAARLGAAVRMVGAVGSDADGSWMIEELAAAGVDTQAVRRAAEPTGVALIVVDAEGENQIAVCEGANGEVTLDGVEFGSDEAVLAQLEISMEVIAALAEAARGYFAVNAAPAIELPAAVVERADLIIVNETEYALLPALRTARRVAVTYGGEGAKLFEDGELVASAPAVKTTVVNSVGAGDAFCAALTIGLASGIAPQRALSAACAVGAAAVADPRSQPLLAGLGEYLPAE
ncbi:MAG: ribokinase [Microbacterium sp. 14-71-5]|uniref:PfkB family carbohydrate kinase n=1 Tax=Microbacterium sp. 13-71-7 TaxID=1970399 RepID=UPI000BD70DEE|nr:PfkB family carbohydrate kinase [Microbacterium sp. 13-71-7]OZB80369.1 MAG: ribokinase [Microbacterium sp. 13-71-7]OZB82296.1 MAG: ribokinase [Microbacterium sp. 14-71-5]